MNNSYARGLWLSPLLLILFSIGVHAQDFVYANNNFPGPNTITAFSVAPNGTLVNIGTFATGGTGSSGGAFAASRATTCMVGNRLYVTNDSSSNVSGFDINPATGSLSLVPGSPFATGGFGFNGISLDCTPNGKFLIAANLGSRNITVFNIAANGALTPVAGSPFSTGGDLADGIKVAPNGQFLSAALPNDEAIGMYSIAANGALSPVPGSPFASFGATAGVEINCASTILYAFQGNGNGTNVRVYGIAPNGTLSLIQVSNNLHVGSNSNVGVLSPNEQFLFVSNQFSDSVTVFNVAPNGTISLVAGSPFSNMDTGSEPAGIATNAAGTFLFTANHIDETISSFSIAPNGALTFVGNFGTQIPFGDLLSLAVFPGKSCPPTFDVCLQDDSNPSVVFRGNSQTGEYRFCCDGLVFSGVATITRKGNLITFRHNAPDRRLLATVDLSVSRGSASFESPPGTMRCTIADRNTRNNTCACP